ncbi:MAG: hypothetical protein GY716_12360 [bacterium]|nr:hypothetical protein [bacterium]
MNCQRKLESGFAVVSVMLLMALMGSMLIAYFALTQMELGATRSSMDSTRGYYAAEAGLNIRAERIRRSFLGYRRPSGTSPDEAAGTPCLPGNSGAGSFRCVEHDLESRAVTTFIKEHPQNPRRMVVPRGERFQNLAAQVYEYTIPSVAYGRSGRPEAILELEVESRLIPLFQFAAFYGKDLEILPGPSMTLAGPVHVNGDLYLNALNSLNILGQVTASGDLYRGRKALNECDRQDIRVIDAGGLPRSIPACRDVRLAVPQKDLDASRVLVDTHVERLEIPSPDTLKPQAGQPFWTHADMRIAMDLNVDPPEFSIHHPDGSKDFAATSNLRDCDVIRYSHGLRNVRENTTIRMMNVDMEGLLDCAAGSYILEEGKLLDEGSDGGLVFHFSVQGPREEGINNYGVKLYNAEELVSSNGGAPTPRGLTVVSDQAMYLQGDYNSVNKKPAAVLADTINVLSNDWDDANSTEELEERIAANTVVNAAFLAGMATTGDVAFEGPGGQDRGKYNGGLENYPRMHEDWTDRTLTYRGSFVSLNQPVHVKGLWELSSYEPPRRDWNYDTDFNDAAKLPPLTPRSVYMKQNMFVRKFDF